MMDLSDKGSECEDMVNLNSSGSASSSDGGNSTMKTCVDCGTTKTPLWRGGPAGPKSLCNACGIRSRKRRRALMGLTKDDKKPKYTTTAAPAATSTSGGESQSSGLTTNKSSNMGDYSLKRKLMGLGTEVVLQRPRTAMAKQRRKLGEVEQAALLLMAISCGSVYA